MTKRAGLGVALLLAVIPAGASFITIFNTGVNSSGLLLPGGATDPHYTVAPPGSPRGPAFVVSPTGFPLCVGVPCPWVPDGPNSNWIAPFGPIPGFVPVGNYVYTTTFDLTGLVPGTAALTGQWMTDNNGVAIILNGNVVNNFTTPFTSFTGPFSPFAINSGFVPGVNTLQFVVFEDGFITGFRAEVSGTAEVVPEPATLLLTAIGMGCVALRRRLHAA